MVTVITIVSYDRKTFIVQGTGEEKIIVVGKKSWYHVRYLSTLLYKQDPATEFTKLGSDPFKDGTNLAPKLADPLSFWRSGSTPSKYWIKYSWSGLTHILYYIKMSVRWNTSLRNQISLCQQVFYYIRINLDGSKEAIAKGFRLKLWLNLTLCRGHHDNHHNDNYHNNNNTKLHKRQSA